ncbi:hypothetical protein [Corynebacterium lowii]|uniref:PepSY domain-containing protein n=1 Tax=Corynebacterium lowii TaxID=1544413 RepID=A0A0Q0U4K4_9CORY|nr:hypothetical protein [Corynebacterium lowii]KQB86896.1 hypothetical protein Clow_01107 [Corynebacterium lowii]MDP9851584.1 hypothetical protein [Corynebacterium lowii]
MRKISWKLCSSTLIAALAFQAATVPHATAAPSNGASTEIQSAELSEPASLEETQKILEEEGLNEVETETVYVAGVGNVEFTYDYINGTITMVDPDGTTEVVSFQELASISEKADDPVEPITGTQFRRINKEKVCKALATAVGAGHKKTWQVALKIAGVNPWVRAALWLGETGLWLYVRNQC